jgi:hypothetical protein
MLREISMFGSFGAKVHIVGKSIFVRLFSTVIFGIRFEDLVLGRLFLGDCFWETVFGRLFLGLASLQTCARRFSSQTLTSGNCLGNSMFMVSLHQLVCNIGQLHFSALIRNDDVV